MRGGARRSPAARRLPTLTKRFRRAKTGARVPRPPARWGLRHRSATYIEEGRKEIGQTRYHPCGTSAPGGLLQTTLQTIFPGAGTFYSPSCTHPPHLYILRGCKLLYLPPNLSSTLSRELSQRALQGLEGQGIVTHRIPIGRGFFVAAPYWLRPFGQEGDSGRSAR